jgi:hypothetical protein
MKRLPDEIVSKILLYNSTILADMIRYQIDDYNLYYMWYKENFPYRGEPECFYKIQLRYNRLIMMNFDFF